MDKPKRIRLSDETWERFKKAKEESKFTWEDFIQWLLEQV